MVCAMEVEVGEGEEEEEYLGISGEDSGPLKPILGRNKKNSRRSYKKNTRTQLRIQGIFPNRIG